VPVLEQAGEGAEVDHGTRVTLTAAPAHEPNDPLKCVGIPYMLPRTRPHLVQRDHVRV
jgi:hypothetical protein